MTGNRNGFCRVTGKRRYRDELGAKIALSVTRSKPGARREECRTYRCGACGGWHLTKRPR